MASAVILRRAVVLAVFVACVGVTTTLHIYVSAPAPTPTGRIITGQSAERPSIQNETNHTLENTLAESNHTQEDHKFEHPNNSAANQEASTQAHDNFTISTRAHYLHNTSEACDMLRYRLELLERQIDMKKGGPKQLKRRGNRGFQNQRIGLEKEKERIIQQIEILETQRAVDGISETHIRVERWEPDPPPALNSSEPCLEVLHPYDMTFGLPDADVARLAKRAFKSPKKRALKPPLEPCRLLPPEDCDKGDTLLAPFALRKQMDKHDGYLRRSACAPLLCPHIATEVSETFRAWAEFANRINVTWWISAGNLLGFVRNGGLMPWDDDIDVSMWDEDVLKLARAVAEDPVWALYVRPQGGRSSGPFSANLYKMFRVGAAQIPHSRFRGVGFPSIDIWLATRPTPGHRGPSCPINGLSAHWQDGRPYGDLFPLHKRKWNNVTVWMPHRPLSILDATYGPSWRTSMAMAYDHVRERVFSPHARMRFEISDPPERMGILE